MSLNSSAYVSLSFLYLNIHVFLQIWKILNYYLSSIQFSPSVLSDSLWPHEPQHTRPSCPSPTPRVHPNPCPSSWRCHPTISSSVAPFSSCPALNLSQLRGLSQWVSSSHQVAKYWSFSFNISLSNEHPGLVSFRMDWLDLLAVQGTFKSVLQHHSSKASTSLLSFLYSPTLTSIHDHWKNHSLD